MLIEHDKFYIGGDWVSASSTATIGVWCASTEKPLGRVPAAAGADVDLAVAAAREAFDDPSGWSRWEPARRADAMERLATALDARADGFAQHVSTQNGMPVTSSHLLEGVFPPLVLRYFAGLARDSATEETRAGMMGGSIVVQREPVGVVAAIAPWNDPQMITTFKYAPALAAGCTVVIKPSSEAVLDSYLFAEAVVEAAIPPGVINIVPGDGNAGAYLVSHPDVDKVSFTGSTAVGRAIAEVCGRLLRPVTLELGGKSAAILLDDVELDLPVIGDKLYFATLLNNGQTCFLGTRILAPRSRYDEIVDALAAFVSSLTVGDALDPATRVGPLVNARQRDRVESYLAKGRAEGARVVTGGGRPAGLDCGWFVEPTVFADVDNNHTIAQEEIFGPVLSVIPYVDEDDAVRIANDSEYGLGGSVWTADHERGVALAKRVHTGTIGINGYLPDPTAPFGGIKASGMGSELGPESMAAYQRGKSIYL
jgi:aldehyde dehydrogenase (NAD+)